MNRRSRLLPGENVRAGKLEGAYGAAVPASARASRGAGHGQIGLIAGPGALNDNFIRLRRRAAAAAEPVAWNRGKGHACRRLGPLPIVIGALMPAWLN